MTSEYTYQVEQMYDQFGNHNGVCAVMAYLRPFDNLFDAVETLQKAAFPGFIQRLHNGITAGAGFYKWKGDDDYHHARLVTLGYIQPEDTIERFSGHRRVGEKWMSCAIVADRRGVEREVLWDDPTSNKKESVNV
jgi:hypothetical protein